MSYSTLDNLLDDICKAYFRYVDNPDPDKTDFHELEYTYTDANNVTRTNNSDFYTKVTSQTGLSSDFMFFFKPDSKYVYLILNSENHCFTIGRITVDSLEFENDSETTSKITVSLVTDAISINYTDYFLHFSAASDVK